MDYFIEQVQPVVNEMRARSRKPSGRGGRRPGAGRKRELTDAVRATTVLDGPDFERVAAIALQGGSTVASVIREAVKAFLRRLKET
jgi:hypothetical protein